MFDYIKNPHLPTKQVKLVLVDRRIEKKYLSLINYTIVQSFSHNNILEGINSHPDMTFCHLKDNIAVVAKGSYTYYHSQLNKYGFKLIEGTNEMKKEYPYDIALNCVLLNNILFHNLKYTDKKILEFAYLNNYKLVNVKQGYTKCSTLIVNENSVITSDTSLNKVFKENGIDSIYVSNEGIKINNFDTGFIGGAGGKISGNKIAFFGDIIKHKDYTKISDFLNSKNVSFYSLTNDYLFDYGSLIPLLHT